MSGRWLLLSLLAIAPFEARVAPSPPPQERATSPSSFTWVDVWVDSGQTPLAAWQVKVRATEGQVSLVGVEGVDFPDARKAPWFDEKARGGSEVIVASFSPQESLQLPRGRVCVARLHLEVRGSTAPRFAAEAVTAATFGGARFPITVNVVKGK